MQNTDTLSSDKLGKEKLGKLILKMSAPAMLSMLVQALYNIVDTIFISRIAVPSGISQGLVTELADQGLVFSDLAVRALSFAMPYQMLVMAFALGIGVGANSLVSRKLGEGRRDHASLAAQTGLFMALVMGVFFLISGYFLSQAFIGIHVGADTEINSTVLSFGISYLSVVMMCSIFMFLEILLSRVLQGTGNMIVPMIAQLIGALTNIALDPLFIFTFNMGVTGAAVATVLGQFAAFLFVLIVVIVKKPAVRIFFTKAFRFKKHIMTGILIIALPTLVMNAVGSFIIILLNGLLSGLNESAVNVLGFYFKLQSFVFMPVFGMNQGVLPIMGYNYGAKNNKRLLKTYFICLAVAMGIMLVGFFVFQFAPDILLTIFNAQGDVLIIGREALRIISYCFIPAAFGIITVTLYSAIGHGIKSLFMSLMRQIIFLLPTAYALGLTAGLPYVWACYPIAEYATALIFIPITVSTVKKIFRNNRPMSYPLTLQG